MLFLPQLAVVFVGIAGGNRTVDTQVEKVLREAHVERAKLAPGDIKALTRHRETSKEIVRRLHADGVIGGELVDAHTLRIVIYRGDGAFKSLSETQVAGKGLAGSELSVMKSNLLDEIQALAPAHDDADQIEMEPTPAAKPEPKPAPPPPPVAKIEPPKPAAAPARKAASLDDDETPPGLGAAPARRAAPPPPPPPPVKIAAKASPPPPPPAPAAKAEAEPVHEAAPTETASAEGDSVKADEIEAMLNSNAGGGSSESQTQPGSDASLHLRATAGLGIATRSFAPGPVTVTGYDSSPVGALQLGAEVAPTARTALAVTFDTALGMTTPVANGIADTSMSRWEVAGAYQLVQGTIAIAPTLGFGHRTFAIHSTDPARSPDGDYNYLALGAVASTSLGSRITLRGTFAFEPVVSGNEMTESAFGEASRWAFAVGAAVDARVLSHVFVRVAADYQRFAWSWDGAGARGAGGAVDAYPSGTMSLGADY